MKPRSASIAPACALAALLAQASVSQAATGATPPPHFMACASETDDSRRLACFDAAVARVATSAGPSAPADAGLSAKGGGTATAPVVAAPPLSKEEKFGLRGELKEEKARQAPELAELKELQAQVTNVAVKPHGQLILTLDNGQVWHEIQANSGIRVKAGDRVTIRSGALGSFSVVAPNGRSSKVTRAR
jgi:hypothetical protein